MYQCHSLAESVGSQQLRAVVLIVALAFAQRRGDFQDGGGSAFGIALNFAMDVLGGCGGFLPWWRPMRRLSFSKLGSGLRSRAVLILAALRSLWRASIARSFSSKRNCLATGHPLSRCRASSQAA